MDMLLAMLSICSEEELDTTNNGRSLFITLLRYDAYLEKNIPDMTKVFAIILSIEISYMDSFFKKNVRDSFG